MTSHWIALASPQKGRKEKLWGPTLIENWKERVLLNAWKRMINCTQNRSFQVINYKGCLQMFRSMRSMRVAGSLRLRSLKLLEEARCSTIQPEESWSTTVHRSPRYRISLQRATEWWHQRRVSLLSVLHQGAKRTTVTNFTRTHKLWASKTAIQRRVKVLRPSTQTSRTEEQ